MNWSNAWAAVSSIVAAITLVILVLTLIFRRLRVVKDQNDKQLAEQRRVRRELFGEDPDGGPNQLSLRQMVGTVLENTRTLPDRMTTAESRLGKHEERLDLHDHRLALVEEHILRKQTGGS